MAFVLKLGRGLHRYGYPAHRLEEALVAVARRLGLEAHLFSLPTALFASFGDERGQRSFQMRVEPGSMNLARLAALDELAEDVAVGRLDPTEGGLRIDAIESAPPPYPAGLGLAAFALASAAAARFLGGGWAEMGAGALIGLAIGLLALLAERVTRLGLVFEPLAATVAAFLAALLAALGLPLSVYLATLAGLIVLVPGLTLTVALNELARRHLMSGTARLAGALGTFFFIAFGVALGDRLGGLLPHAQGLTRALPAPAWTEWAALLLAPLAFSVLLRARPRESWAVLLSGAVAYLGARGGGDLLGPEIGAFLGALLVGVCGNAYARLLGRVSAVVMVPGLLLLVPGSVGFLALSALVDRQTLSGLDAGFRMVLSAVSLVMGLVFANVIVSPRVVAGDPQKDAGASSPRGCAGAPGSRGCGGAAPRA